MGVTLQSARRGAGISQRDLARRAGVSQSHLSRFEAGERPISLVAYEHLQAALAALLEADAA